jgi:hypothetical protein
MISGESVMTRSSYPVRCGKWPGSAPTDPGCAIMMRCAASRRQGATRPRSQQWVVAMRQSELDQINAGLDRAEFAIRELRKKLDELHRKAPLAKTLEEMAALKLEVAELLQQLQKVSAAVHGGNPAPHLRLVSDIE